MATKKVTKKAPEIKTIADMNKDLAEKQKSFVEAKRGHKMGELANPRYLTVTRKEIARLKTAIRLAELVEAKENK